MTIEQAYREALRRRRAGHGHFRYWAGRFVEFDNHGAYLWRIW